MNRKSSLIAAIALAVSSGASIAKADDATFDRTFYSEFTDMQRNAARAYGDQKYDDAIALFRRAACAGDKESQSALGRMYLLGQGVEHDDLTGYAWLKVAAETQFPGYQAIVRKLEDAMNDEQRKIADARATELQGLYGLRATNMSCKARASRGGHIIDTIECTPRAEGRVVLLRMCVANTPH